MALGKVSGSMLESNLLRLGTDLSIDTNLIYFNVTSKRIGINNASPTVELDVVGNSHITGQAHISDLALTGSSIYTTAIDSDLQLIPDGTGQVKVFSPYAMLVPKGMQSQRPATLESGLIRFNTDTAFLEYYNGTTWVEAANANAGNVGQQTIQGDGVTVSFPLNFPGTTEGLIVSINGTVQRPGTAYSSVGNSIVFTEAPLSTDFIDIRTISSYYTIRALSDSTGDTRVEVEHTSNENKIRFTTNSVEHLVIDELGRLDASGSHSVGLPVYSRAQTLALNNTKPGQVVYVKDGIGGALTTTTFSNTAISSQLTLSNSNRTATLSTGGGQWETVAANGPGFINSLQYWEVEYQSGTSATAPSIGIMPMTNAVFNNTDVGDIVSNITEYGVGMNAGPAGGIIKIGGSIVNAAFPMRVLPGDIVGVATDALTGKIWYSLNGVWANGGDPFFSNVKLLAHLEVNETDVKGHTIIDIQGTPTVDAVSPKWGVSSIKFNYLDTIVYEPSPDFDMNGEGTVDLWLYPEAHGDAGTGSYVYTFGSTFSNFFRLESNGACTWAWNGVQISAPVGTITLNNWQHIEISAKQYSLGIYDVYMFVNGYVVAQYHGAQVGSPAISNLHVGGYESNSPGGMPGLIGKIQDMRVTKAPRHVASFTPPITAAPEVLGGSDPANGIAPSATFNTGIAYIPAVSLYEFGSSVVLNTNTTVYVPPEGFVAYGNPVGSPSLAVYTPTGWQVVWFSGPL